MSQHKIYRITSIGRPLEPRYATNKAVLMLMPVGGLVAAAAQTLRGASVAQAGIAALIGIAVVFGSWALARELSPDNNRSAFVSMALAFGVVLAGYSPSLLLLFTTLFLVRVVNRSVGRPAKLSDCAIVTMLCVWTAWSLQSPLFALVGAVAFGSGASLRGGQSREWLFAVACLAGAGLVFVRSGPVFENASLPAGAPIALIAIVALAYGVLVALTRRVESTGDITGEPLSPGRVRAGMLVGLLSAGQALSLGEPGIEGSAILWATLAGVASGLLF